VIIKRMCRRKITNGTVKTNRYRQTRRGYDKGRNIREDERGEKDER
jgi:hypothetical protein